MRPLARQMRWQVAAAFMIGAALLVSCAPAGAHLRSSPLATPPPLAGRFADDYGDHYEIDLAMWRQIPGGRYRIVEWNVAQQFLVAQNDSANRTEPGLWTRIDWLPLSSMAPYTWGFCMTTWKAPSREAARATPAPKRDAPRTGCGGFPFTRLQAETRVP